MTDRRQPSEAQIVAEKIEEKIEQKIETKTKILAGFGSWTLGLLGATFVTFVILIWNQTQQLTLTTHKLDALIEIVNEMRAELKAADDRYFSKSAGADHEARLRVLESRMKR